MKFFLDGDGEFPTICGTGTEDYFCGSYNFDVGGQYTEFTTPYAGMPQVLRPDGTYRSQQRFGLYRWHLTDPIRFRTDLRVTMQALGWRPRPALPPAAGRHRHRRLLVPDAARSRRSRRSPTATPARSSTLDPDSAVLSSPVTARVPRAVLHHASWRRVTATRASWAHVHGMAPQRGQPPA